MTTRRSQLRALAEQLTEPINGQYPRPWMTRSRHPEHARVFLVGLNQATICPGPQGRVPADRPRRQCRHRLDGNGHLNSASQAEVKAAVDGTAVKVRERLKALAADDARRVTTTPGKGHDRYVYAPDLDREPGGRLAF